MLFQLVSRRYQNKSTLITTNRAFGDVFTQQRGDDYLSYSNRHADMLFQLVSRRYQNKSTLITTNRAFGDVFTQQRGDD
jgi:DNA replication protein DnaC